jgi:hypothetical protein
MSSAQRMQVLRSRRAAGCCVVPIEISEADLEALIAAHLLDPLAEHEREDIAAAIKKLLQALPHEQ